MKTAKRLTLPPFESFPFSNPPSGCGNDCSELNPNPSLGFGSDCSERMKCEAQGAFLQLGRGCPAPNCRSYRARKPRPYRTKKRGGNEAVRRYENRPRLRVSICKSVIIIEAPSLIVPAILLFGFHVPQSFSHRRIVRRSDDLRKPACFNKPSFFNLRFAGMPFLLQPLIL